MTSVTGFKQIHLNSNILILFGGTEVSVQRGVETLTANTFYRDQGTISCPRLHKHQFVIHYNLPEISPLSDDELKSAFMRYEQNKNQCFKQNWTVSSTNINVQISASLPESMYTH